MIESSENKWSYGRLSGHGETSLPAFSYLQGLAEVDIVHILN